MDFIVFQKQVAAQVQEKLTKAVRVEIGRVIKNNGVVRNGIRIFAKESNAAPMIYLDELYREYCDGRTVQSIAGQIVRLYEKSRLETEVSLDFLNHYDQVRNQIVYRLVNYRRNEAFLKTVPHVRFLDMAVIFSCLVWHDALDGASILIQNRHCEMWNTDADGLFLAAAENTPRRQKVCVRSMEEVIRELFEEKLRKESERFLQNKFSGRSREQAVSWAEEMKEELERELGQELAGGTPMYVMGNADRRYGAGTILYPHVLQEVAARLGHSLFILPCSIHEVILVPDTGREDAVKLQQMVKEVNGTQLETEDILSDSVYYFDQGTGKVTVLREEK